MDEYDEIRASQQGDSPKCSCGKEATKIAMDSEVGPEAMCNECAEKWFAKGNVNEATVWQVEPI
jgi:hypothetical protein